MSWIKTTAIGTGLAVGVLAAFTVMVPTSQRTEAAVAVIDQQNIAEAIKTAINTATILTNTEKEIALQILNMKQIDAETIINIISRQEEKKEQAFNERQNMTGLLAGTSSVGQVWDERMGNLDDVINGNITIYDAVKREQRRQKVLDETAKSASQAAANAMINSQNNMEDVNEALEISNNAEGHLQAAQAGNAIMANTAYAVENGNRLLSNITAMMAAQYQQENLRRAESQRIMHDSSKMSSEWVENATIQK